MINGIDDLAVTNVDGLDGLERIQLCTHYKLGRKRLEVPPTDSRQLAYCQPVYVEFEGWNQPTTEARTWSQLPAKAREYLQAVADLTGAKLAIASVGPGRDQTIVL
jgi:adenylosuccinate synthase